ncbi:MAG: signal peptide peptidase SppA [Aigarchaeota archaeon]|nr:signal peptide peptidase SppA [Aigarchaeota archaeon]
MVKGLKWWVWLLIGILIGSITMLSLSISFQVSRPINRLEYVALVELSGSIAYSESPLTLFSGEVLTPSDVEDLVSQIRRDPTIKAVVLVINSPGGSAAASEEIYTMFKKLSEEKILVSYITEYGASGGYYIALPSKEIIASPHSLTGSVGAISIVISWKELMDKLGIKSETFKSGELKDIGSSWKDITDEERRVMTSIINSIADIFKERVREHRGGKIVDWSEVFTARPYTGLQALQVGLVDGIGSLDDAVKKARQLSGLPEDAPTKWIKPRAPTLLELLLGGSSTRVMKLSYEVLLMWPLPDFSTLRCNPQGWRAYLQN